MRQVENFSFNPSDRKKNRKVSEHSVTRRVGMKWRRERSDLDGMRGTSIIESREGLKKGLYNNFSGVNIFLNCCFLRDLVSCNITGVNPQENRYLCSVIIKSIIISHAA